MCSSYRMCSHATYCHNDALDESLDICYVHHPIITPFRKARRQHTARASAAVHRHHKPSRLPRPGPNFTFLSITSHFTLHTSTHRGVGALVQMREEAVGVVSCLLIFITHPHLSLQVVTFVVVWSPHSAHTAAPCRTLSRGLKELKKSAFSVGHSI
jgi:hypothetical protein